LSFLAVNVHASGKKQTVSENTYPPKTSSLGETSYKDNQTTIKSGATVAEKLMKAFVAAYPRRVEKAEYRRGDWAVLLRGTWHYYAEGKLLPEEFLSNAGLYDPGFMYQYPAELPAWKKPSADDAARYREMASNRKKRNRSQFFFENLWRSHNRDESYQRVKSMLFLGKSVTVHYAIMEDLSLVEDRILTLAKRDPQIQSWINGINRIEGWNWRNIADVQSKSFHAYGAAIDILPKSNNGKETYWLWVANKRPDWWNVSYNERMHPPAAVIKAFEAYGFIWGGKWLFYDTMHFEYRPEVLIFNEFEMETLR
jgi:hypothetical protein